MNRKCTYYLALMLSISVGCSSQDPDIQLDNPETVQFINEDIERFWIAYDSTFSPATPPELRATTMQELYLGPGTPGLDRFRTSRLQNAGQLVAALETMPEYYTSIRETTLSLPELKMEQQIKDSFFSLQMIYPAAQFTDVYFLIGRMGAGGTLSDQGLLIGVELFSRTSDTPLHELTGWQRDVGGTPGMVPLIVAHELVHLQQKYINRVESLLERAITEGSADFISELIAGAHPNQHIHDYGNPRENELWDEFQAEMHASDYSNWLYNAGRSGNRPADLGYFIGYKICEAYYNGANDKEDAIRHLLEIEDFSLFLYQSGYNP